MKIKNWKVVIYSIIAIICMIFVFTLDWLFIIPVVIILFLNQKELIKNKLNKNKK